MLRERFYDAETGENFLIGQLMRGLSLQDEDFLQVNWQTHELLVGKFIELLGHEGVVKVDNHTVGTSLIMAGLDKDINSLDLFFDLP